MKKIASFVLVAMICLGIFNPGAIASEEVSVPVLDREFLTSADIVKEGDVVVLTREVVSKSSRSTITSCAREAVTLIPAEGFSTDDLIKNIDSFVMSRASGSKYEEAYDSTITAKISMTIYYDRQGGNIKLTKVSGETDVTDPMAYGVDPKLNYGSVGHGATNQYAYVVPTTRTWSYTMPSSWKYVPEDGAFTTVGAHFRITLKRGGSSWTHSLDNNVVANGGSIF